MNEALIHQPEVITDESSGALVRMPQQTPSLFGTNDPVEVISKATHVASALKDVLRRQNLIKVIQGKEYPLCEAWTLLGTMLGVFPVLLWSRPQDDGWEARVEARTRDGSVVGAAEAQCCRAERSWSNRDDFALRSMAQTRATAKALRMPLGFVMTLAGYCATPAEEMTGDAPAQSPTPPAKSKKSAPPKTATAKTRAWFLDELRKRFDEPTLQRFFKLEDLDDIPLEAVPISKAGLEAAAETILAAVKAGEAGQQATPQSELADLITTAGFTFDQFQSLVLDLGALKQEHGSFDELPTERAAWCLKNSKAILSGLIKSATK